MKTLVHRLRSRRASRRDDGLVDDIESNVVFVENVNHSIRNRWKSVGSKREEGEQVDGKWKKDRDVEYKTDDCYALATTSVVQGPAGAISPSSVSSSPLAGQPKLKNTASETTITQVAGLEQCQQKLLVTKSRVKVTATNNDDQGVYMIASSTTSGQRNRRAGQRTRSETGSFVSSSASYRSLCSHKSEMAVDVRYSGILKTKRGLLQMTDKRYYFVVRCTSELYSCKDETSFKLWLASGHPLERGDAAVRFSGLSPVLVGTVLRVDVALEEGDSNGDNHSKKTLQVVLGLASKCSTQRFVAESDEEATRWREALKEVQVTELRRNNFSSRVDTKLLLPLDIHNELCGAGTVEKLASETDVKNVAGEGSDHSSEARGFMVVRSASPSQANLPRAYVNNVLQRKPRAAEDDDATPVSTPTSYTGSSSTSAVSEQADCPAPSSFTSSPVSVQSLPTSRLHQIDSVPSCSSTASVTQGNSNGNVLLFVPAAGSSLTASASRMEKAQEELNMLAARGAKLPSRIMQDPVNGEPVAWRYGVPEYVLTDLAYVKGRMCEQDSTPLISYVEECCQTFIMEATHKARYDQWRSVYQDTFYLQVNDGVRVPGGSILENDMLGLLYLRDAEGNTSGSYGDGDESRDPRAELADAFPDGFPMEVLNVFTQPPQCYFSWRHWGPFTGRYRGVKGDGVKVEIRGFGEMTVDAGRMRGLRLFFDQKNLVTGLQQATNRVTRPRRVPSLVSRNETLRRPKRAASAAAASTTCKSSLSNPKTSDIIESLANFTIEARKQHKAQ